MVGFCIGYIYTCILYTLAYYYISKTLPAILDNLSGGTSVSNSPAYIVVCVLKNNRLFLLRIVYYCLNSSGSVV